MFSVQSSFSTLNPNLTQSRPSSFVSRITELCNASMHAVWSLVYMCVSESTHIGVCQFQLDGLRFGPRRFLASSSGSEASAERWRRSEVCWAKRLNSVVLFHNRDYMGYHDGLEAVRRVFMQAWATGSSSQPHDSLRLCIICLSG